MVKLLADVLAEGVASSSGRDAPAAPVVRVRPEQVAHGAFVRNFLHPVQLPDLVEFVEGGGETAVETEDLVLYDRSQREHVKQVCEVLPHICRAVLSQALVIESVNLSNLATFVVASQNCYSILESDFVANQKCDCLNTIVSSI